MENNELFILELGYGGFNMTDRSINVSFPSRCIAKILRGMLRILFCQSRCDHLKPGLCVGRV